MVKKVSKETPIVAYKGFGKDFTCRDFQYEIGKEYHADGDIELCRNGFHACEKPIDVFSNYHMSYDKRYAVVELWGDVMEDKSRGIVCASDIMIVKELPITDLINIGIDLSHGSSMLPKESDLIVDTSVIFDKENGGIYYQGIANEIMSNGINQSIYSDGESNTVYSSGRGTEIQMLDINGKVISDGDGSRVSSCGDGSYVSIGGSFDKVFSSGNNTDIVSYGYIPRIVSKGSMSNILSCKIAEIYSSGAYSTMFSSGYDSRIASVGNMARIGVTGYNSYVNSSGDKSKIMSSGNMSSIDSTGDKAVIMCSGNKSIAKAKKGSWIVLTEYDGEVGDNTQSVKCIKAEYVDGEKIKEDTWYILKDGEFKEV